MACGARRDDCPIGLWPARRAGRFAVNGCACRAGGLRVSFAWGLADCRCGRAGSGKSYVLITGEPVWWDADGWWRSEKSGQFVLTELIKMGYYVWKY